MKIEDTGIIISSYKFGDTALVVKILSQNHGVIKGLLKGQRRNHSTIQSGNLVHFTWSARLSEHLGMLSISLEKAYSLLNFSDYQKILSISSLCSLLDALLPEREEYSDIFEEFIAYMHNLSFDNWLQRYIMMELLILNRTGFGIDLEKCSVTGTSNNVTYISPKSGSAVSKDVGEPYKSRLFKIPAFFLEKENEMVQKQPTEMQEILEGLEITRYFFAKHFFTDSFAKLPSNCIQFRDELNRVLNLNVEKRENRDYQLQGSA
jgi:DNA repair protein RecO (recombination protein O)